LHRSLSIVETLGSVNVLCSVRAAAGGIHIYFCGELIAEQDKTGTLTQNKMHVEDAAIYDATFSVSSLRERLQSASPSVAENLRQLPTVSVICNAASFEGSPSDSRRNIIGDATGERLGPISRKEVHTYSPLRFFHSTRLGNIEIWG
jgi:sodium/potassium-transporting ATPase subunit alpha